MRSMNCSTARELMLEADLDELRGISDGPLAEHIRDCESCAPIAAQLLRQYDLLEIGLRDVARVQKKKSWKWMPVPLAAAAVIALLITQRAEPPVAENPVLVSLMFREQPVVTAPADKQVVVVEKNDLTVVWLY